MSDPALAARFIELRQEKQKLLDIRSFRQQNGLDFYRPHAKQHAFHICTATGRYGRTGNRFGKSEMGTGEDAAYCIGGRLWYKHKFDVLNGERKVVYQHPGGDNHPYVTAGIPQRPVKGLILVVDWDKAAEIFTNMEGDFRTWGKLFKLVPSSLISKVIKNRQGYVVQVNIKRPDEYGGGESVLCFDTIQSWKNNTLAAESGDWDFIHVDEPVPEDMFKGYARGLMDRNGRYWFTCTPLNEMWINDKFTPETAAYGSEEEGLLFKDKFIIEGSIYDNPYRNDAGVEEYKNSLTKEEVECRLYGIPLAMAGRIYKEFKHDVHVLSKVPSGWLDYHTPPSNYTIRQFWDYHTRLPQAILFTATDPHGRVYVYDEMFDDNLIKLCCETLNKKSEGLFVADRKIDPFALIEDPVRETTIVDELLNYGLYFEAASKDKKVGINKVKERLLERDSHGLPTILFSPHLTETLYEFSHYTWDPKKNEPIDKFDHMMENLYRMVLNGLEYITPPSEADYEHRRDIAIRPDQDLRDSYSNALK